MIRLFLILSFFASFTPAHALNRRSQLCIWALMPSKPTTAFHFETYRTKIEPEKLNELKKLLGDVIEFLQPKFNLPGEVEVAIDDELYKDPLTEEDREAGFSYHEGRIRVPSNRISIKVHELGHAILDHLLLSKLRNFPGKVWQTHLEHLNYIAKAVQATTEEDERDAARALQFWEMDLKRQDSDLYYQVVKESEVHRMMGHYHELFADLLAVVFFKSGTAISENILDPDHAQYRDFTRKWAVRGYSQEEPHESLAPVRSFIWTRYLSDPNVLDKDGLKILNKVFIAIVEEVKHNLRGGKLHTSSIETMNRRMIERLK